MPNENSLFETAQWLEAKRNQGYGRLPIPNNRDEEISELIRKWMLLDSEARTTESSKVTKSQQQTFQAYSERMASLAVRAKNDKYITLGIVALYFGDWYSEWQDIVRALSLHYHSARLLNVSPKEIFSQVGNFLSSAARTELDRFLQRNEHDKSLDAMKHIESSDEDGFRYQSTWKVSRF